MSVVVLKAVRHKTRQEEGYINSMATGKPLPIRSKTGKQK